MDTHQLGNRAANDSMRSMYDIRASGPWTPIQFTLRSGEILLSKFREDTAGVRIAFLFTDF